MNQTPSTIKERLSDSLDENLNLFHCVFQDDTTIKFRLMACGAGHRQMAVIFADGMINNVLINEHIIEPLLCWHEALPENQCASFVRRRILFSNEISEASQTDGLITEILSGNTVLLIDGEASALVLSTRGYMTRSISEPPAEKVLQGPREGFTEALLFNLSMLRRKLCSPNLRFRFRRVGKQSNTMVALAYMDGIADPGVVEEVSQRLSRIDIDGILDANYIEELIKDAPWSPFKTIGSTERPDIVAAKLLEGRVAILVDGTPVVLTAPFFLLEYFQSNDDYYSNFYMGTFGRWLRILGFFSTISLPAIFLGLFTLHQELLPTRFLLNLTAARENLPFPTFLEMLILILGFELIREGGAKAPANFGQTLGIVGGLVLGQAAVEARLVSIPVVIIIAFTGITGLMIPQLKSPVILFRLLFLVLASIWGIPGYLCGIFFLLLYLSSLQSFSIPYTSALSSDRQALLQDTLFRSPWFFMRRRPDYIAPVNRRRQSGPQQKSRLLCLLPLLLFLCSASGCSAAKEINDVQIVSGLCVYSSPQENSRFIVYAQVPETREGAEGSQNIRGAGPTFAAAVEDCRSNAEKDIYWNHAKSIALEEGLPLSQLQEIVLYVMEHREMRIASDLLLFRPASEGEPQFQHLKLQEMLLSDEAEQLIPSKKVYQLFHELCAGDVQIKLPLLTEQPDGSLLATSVVLLPAGDVPLLQEALR